MKIPVDFKSSDSLFGLDMILYIMKHHYPELNFVPPVNVDWGLFPHPLFTSAVKQATTVMFMESKNKYDEEFNRIFNESCKKVSFVTFLYEEGIEYWIKQLPLTHEYFMMSCIRYAIFTANAYSMGTTTAPTWTSVHLSEMIKKLRKAGYITNRFWEKLETYCSNSVVHASLVFFWVFVLISVLIFFIYWAQWFELDTYFIFWIIVAHIISITFLFRTMIP